MKLFRLKQLLLILCTTACMLVGVEWLLRLRDGLSIIDDVPYILVNKLRVFTPNVDAVITGGAYVPIHVKTNAEGYAMASTPFFRHQFSSRMN